MAAVKLRSSNYLDVREGRGGYSARQTPLVEHS